MSNPFGWKRWLFTIAAIAPQLAIAFYFGHYWWVMSAGMLTYIVGMLEGAAIERSRRK